MTDAELRDAAVGQLELTTVGWLKSGGQPRYPSGVAPSTSHWGRAMALLAQIGAAIPPPTPGVLELRPPGWNGNDPALASSYPGFVVVDAFEKCIDNAKDYFVPSFAKAVKASLGQGQGRTVACHAPGGRHIVCLGAEVDVQSVSVYDDAITLLIDGGNPAGVVHIEGWKMPSAVNAITLRTPRRFQLAYSWLGKSYVVRNDHVTGGVHPDVLQVWDGGAPNVAIDHFRAGYTFTGLTALLPPNPATYSARRVTIEAQPLEPDSIKTVKGWKLAGGNVMYFGDQKVTAYDFSECFCLPGSADGGATRKLQDVFGYGQTAPPYVLSGSGASIGDSISWPSVPLLKGQWRFGADKFVEESKSGLAYAPAGYEVAA